MAFARNGRPSESYENSLAIDPGIYGEILANAVMQVAP
jgi:hypothetical protein